jgi:hypothetical protein
VSATGDYAHCCCEQTAAKILSAATLYAMSVDNLAQRLRAEELIIAGVRRESAMWLPRRGFKAYPGGHDKPDTYVGPLASRHLQFLQLLREFDGQLSCALSDALYEANIMAQDTAIAYGLDWPPQTPHTAVDAYAAVRFHEDKDVRSRAGQWMREHVDGLIQNSWIKNGEVSGSVRRRTSIAYAAAALLRLSNGHELGLAMRLANMVLGAFGSEGRLYSTVDSIAAIALLAELQAAGIGNSGRVVQVNGSELSLDEATTFTGDVQVVEATGGRTIVQMNRIVTESWETLRSSVPLDVTLRSGIQQSNRFTLGETLELVATLRDGYCMGDLLWVSLPHSLSRLYGGGQLKQFEIDLRCQDQIVIPLATTSRTRNVDGQPASHHFAVCLRNMYDEQRIGYPGLLEVTVV